MTEAVYAELRSLRDENDELRAELRRLRATLAEPDDGPPPPWKIKPQQRALLRLLLRQELVSFDRAALALWGEPFDASRRPGLSTVVSSLRARIGALATIRTIWGEGYCIDPAGRARLRAAWEGE